MIKYIPDAYQKSVLDINYQLLKEKGIKCLLFDLDNTLVPSNSKKLTKKIKEKIKEVKKEFDVYIVSNGRKSRVSAFAKCFEVKYYHCSKKPLKTVYKKIFRDTNYKDLEIAMIGDQFLTDILGANRVGITSILVNPISKNDIVFTKINRIIESCIIRKLRKKDLFKKGKYYE